MTSQSIFSFMVSIYPKRFRQDFGQDMVLHFQDMQHDYGTSKAWHMVAKEYPLTLINEYYSAITHTQGGSMNLGQKVFQSSWFNVWAVTLGFMSSYYFTFIVGLFWLPVTNADNYDNVLTMGLIETIVDLATMYPQQLWGLAIGSIVGGVIVAKLTKTNKPITHLVITALASLSIYAFGAISNIVGQMMTPLEDYLGVTPWQASVGGFAYLTALCIVIAGGFAIGGYGYLKLRGSADKKDLQLRPLTGWKLYLTCAVLLSALMELADRIINGLMVGPLMFEMGSPDGSKGVSLVYNVAASLAGLPSATMVSKTSWLGLLIMTILGFFLYRSLANSQRSLAVMAGISLIMVAFNIALDVGYSWLITVMPFFNGQSVQVSHSNLTQLMYECVLTVVAICLGGLLAQMSLKRKVQPASAL